MKTLNLVFASLSLIVFSFIAALSPVTTPAQVAEDLSAKSPIVTTSYTKAPGSTTANCAWFVEMVEAPASQK